MPNFTAFPIPKRNIAEEKPFIDVTRAPFSAIPDGSTDCTDAIQAAIDAAAASGGRKRIYLPEPASGDFYKCEGSLNFSETDGVEIFGGGARVEPPQDRLTTALVYSGTGGNPFLKIGKSRGLTIRGLGIQNNNASFTGDLISMDSSGTPRVAFSTLIENCLIGGRTAAARHGRSGINMTGAVELFVKQCAFSWTDFPLLSLPAASLLSYTNAVTIQNNRFEEYGEYAMNIYGIVQSLILGNVVELKSGTAGAGYGITDECLGGGGRGCEGVLIYGNGFWDADSGVWIDIRPYGVDVRANFFQLGGSGTAIKFIGGSGTKASVGSNRVKGPAGAKFIDTQIAAVDGLADDGSNCVDGTITYNANLASTIYPNGNFQDAGVATLEAKGAGGSTNGVITARRAGSSGQVGGAIVVERGDTTNRRGGALSAVYDSDLGKDTLALGVTADTTKPDALAKVKMMLTEDGDVSLVGTSATLKIGKTNDALKLKNNTTANETRMEAYIVGLGFKTISVGAADSGGTGFRILRIPN